MDRIGFVVLHYMVIKETIECVESIKERIDTDDYDIVVVDNASPNGTGEELARHYANDEKVHVVCCESNLGFSKGNNVGYRYAKDKLKCNYIVLSNNDILLECDTFSKVLTEDYAQYGYAVLGPKIRTSDPNYPGNNPCRTVEFTEEAMRRLLKRQVLDLRICYVLSYVGLAARYLSIRHRLGQFVAHIKHKPMATMATPQAPTATATANQAVLNTGLHGCFFVLSPRYTQQFDGLREVTFMYNEEWLLYNEMRRHKLLMMYDPRIKVFHAEKIATKHSGKRNGAGMRLRYKREKKSAFDVLAYLSSKG